MRQRKSAMTLVSFAAAASLFLAVPNASAAEARCEIAEPVPGGVLHLVLTSADGNLSSAAGVVEMYTASAPPPLGLRDGTYPWDVPQNALARTGGVLSIGFEARLPLAGEVAWGAGDGDIVPTRLFFVLPSLTSPAGVPIQLSNVTLISGNGVYNSNNNWSVRGSDAGVIVTNAPEPLSLVYSRELMQIISTDPSEPISLFLTPSVPGAVDSIASFYAAGIAAAPERIAQRVADYRASGGACPAEENPPLTLEP